jgi:galactokinase
MTSAYNEGEQCEEGISIVKNNFPEITSFRDCTEQHILGLQNVMSVDCLKGVFCSKRN